MAKNNKNKPTQRPAEQARAEATHAPHTAPLQHSATAAAVAAHQDHDHVGHIVPFKVLFGTFAALIFLTVVTVAASYVDFGRLNLWVALLIAGMKVSLVVYFFMHLKWDRPLNSVIFISALAFVLLFIGFALTDTEEYQPDIEAWSSAQP